MSEDYNKIKLRVKTVEEAIQILTHMALRADERMDNVYERVNSFDASLRNLTVKVETLVDAQIRIEETLSAKVEALAAAQIHTEESLARLADSHMRLEEAHTRLEEAHTRLAEAQVNLAETQAQTDKRLDALIDIVREDREGRNGK